MKTDCYFLIRNYSTVLLKTEHSIERKTQFKQF